MNPACRHGMTRLLPKSLAAFAAAAFLCAFAPESPHAQAVPAAQAIPAPLQTRSGIEALAAMGTPESIAEALRGVGTAESLGAQERAFLDTYLQTLLAILYPAPSHTNGRSVQVSVLLPVKNGVESAKSADAVALKLLEHAKAGQASAVPAEIEGNPLAELAPALAIFRSTSKETAKRSLEAAERLARIFPQSPLPALVKALEAERRQDHTAALPQYRALLDAAPGIWPARLGLARCHVALGQTADAISVLDPLLRERNASADFCAPYSLALYQAGRFDEALPSIRHALAGYPESADLLLAHAHMLVASGDAAAAAAPVAALGRLKFEDARTFWVRSRIATAQGLRADAVDLARKALALAASDPEYLVQLASVLFDAGESSHIEAIALAERALAQPAPNGRPMTPLVSGLRDAARREAARLLLLDAYRHQDWFRAIGYLDAARAAGAGTVPGTDRAIVAAVLRNSGRSAEAIEYSRSWFRESGGSEAAAESYLRALAQASGARYAAAAGPHPDGRAAAPSSTTPTGTAPTSTAGGAAIGQGDLVMLGIVIGILSEASSPEMRSFVQYMQGLMSGSDQAAIPYFRAALVEKADNQEALTSLAEAYLRLGDQEKAKFYARQAIALAGAASDTATDTDLAARIATLKKRLFP